MRHEANLVVALEGMSRAAFRIADELAQNSRSGLTVRFLAKKLELPEEEVEYLVDLNHRLFFTDLTKVKLVPAGAAAVRRISDGLENHGDVESVFRRVRQLDKHDFHHFETHLGLEEPPGKRQAAEILLERYYVHPDSVMEYVATRGFSLTARELFDAVWQSEGGLLPASVLRASVKSAEHEVERAIWELCRGFALVEMFRFDAEDRLVRFVGLMKEIRQWREADALHPGGRGALKPRPGRRDPGEARGLELSERICRLVAAIAARPGRLRGDGELFREDRRRFGEICPEEGDPPLSTCLWIAEGLGWVVRVEDELRAGKLQDLVELPRVARHQAVFDWMTAGGDEAVSRRTMTAALDDLKPNAWYGVEEFVRHTLRMRVENERAVLKHTGGRWQYVSPSAVPHAERTLQRSLEETLFWLGAVARTTDDDGDAVFQVSDLGRCLFTGRYSDSLHKEFPRRTAEFVVQPNFDIVVPAKDVDPLLTVPLDQFAERMSSGAATVYHLSKESFTRAMQDGLDGDAFIAFLLAHNRGGTLPANVLTTLEDWRGGVKRVRIKTLHVVEADDSLVMADLMHRRRLSKNLQVIDPRKVVAYTKVARADLVKELEKEGFVVE